MPGQQDSVTAIRRLNVRDHLTAAPWIEKFKSFRITLTVPVFNAAAAVLFLVAGADKAQTLRAVKESRGVDAGPKPRRSMRTRARPDPGSRPR